MEESGVAALSKWAAWTLSMSKLESPAISSGNRQCGRGVGVGMIRVRPWALTQAELLQDPLSIHTESPLQADLSVGSALILSGFECIADGGDVAEPSSEEAEILTAGSIMLPGPATAADPEWSNALPSVMCRVCPVEWCLKLQE